MSFKDTKGPKMSTTINVSQKNINDEKVLTITLSESGLTISALHGEFDDNRPAWHTVRLTVQQTELLAEFLNLNVVLK